MGKRESAAAVHSCSCFCGVVCFRWRTAGRDGVSITAACLCLLQLTAEFGVQIGGFEDVLCLVVHLLGRCVFLLWSVCFNEHTHTSTMRAETKVGDITSSPLCFLPLCTRSLDPDQMSVSTEFSYQTESDWTSVISLDMNAAPGSPMSPSKHSKVGLS